MSKTIYKGKTIRISSDCYDEMKKNLSPLFKISKYVEEAIFEKMINDKKKEKVIYSSDFKL